MTPANGHHAASKSLLGFQINTRVVSGPIGAGIGERLLLLIEAVSEPGVVSEPPCAGQGRSIRLTFCLIGQHPGGEKGALRVTRSIAELDGVSLRGVAQRAPPGLLLVLIVTVVNQRKCRSVVATVVFVVARDIGCRKIK